MRIWLAVLAPSLAFVALGCGKGGDQATMPVEPTVSVSGVLRYKNAPLADAAVTFFSLDGKIAARGKTDAAGTFTLSTYAPQDGAPPGKYKVVAAVSASREIEPGVLAPEPPGGFTSPIPAKYANPATTDVLTEVKAGQKNELVIDLK